MWKFVCLVENLLSNNALCAYEAFLIKQVYSWATVVVTSLKAYAWEFLFTRLRPKTTAYAFDFYVLVCMVCPSICSFVTTKRLDWFEISRFLHLSYISGVSLYYVYCWHLLNSYQKLLITLIALSSWTLFFVGLYAYVRRWGWATLTNFVPKPFYHLITYYFSRFRPKAWAQARAQISSKLFRWTKACPATIKAKQKPTSILLPLLDLKLLPPSCCKKDP